jgi:hypothetical protein
LKRSESNKIRVTPFYNLKGDILKSYPREKILINEVEYVSVGHYEDSNDAIGRYYPTDWLEGLSNRDPIILAYFVAVRYSQLEESVEYCDDEFDQVLLTLMKEAGSFHRKYFYEEPIPRAEIFEDFVFGQFSSNQQPDDWWEDEEQNATFYQIGEDVYKIRGDINGYGNVFILLDKELEFLEDLENIIELIKLELIKIRLLNDRPI